MERDRSGERKKKKEWMEERRKEDWIAAVRGRKGRGRKDYRRERLNERER